MVNVCKFNLKKYLFPAIVNLCVCDGTPQYMPVCSTYWYTGTEVAISEQMKMVFSESKAM